LIENETPAGFSVAECGFSDFSAFCVACLNNAGVVLKHSQHSWKHHSARFRRP
jgi:hypothetical protein